MQQASVLRYESNLPVFRELVAVWEMKPKTDNHSLDARCLLRCTIAINICADGETTLITEHGRIMKGLKPVALDQN
eukprot:4099096-Amphidinium_carterae.2